MAEFAGKTRVVFVGNLPYDATEQEVQKVFEVAGPVVSFRHVFDRDSNKAKGFGFCEYYDAETAASAVRNLNGVAEVRGRALRVDFAQPDIKDLPKDQRGARDKFGLPPLPPGVILPPGENPAERIHRVMQNIAPAQLLDIMHQLKGLVANNPEQARALLGQNPQLSYAIFQAMLMMNIVDPSVLQRMIVPGSANAANAMSIQNSAFNSAGGYGSQSGPPPNFAHPAPGPGPYGNQPAFNQGGYPQNQPGPAPYQQPGFQGGPPQGYPGAGGPPAGGFRPQGNFAQAGPGMGPGPQQPGYGMPPPQQPPQSGFGMNAGPGQGSQSVQPVANPQQQALLQQVLSMTQQQVDALPPDQRATVLAIRQSAGRM